MVVISFCSPVFSKRKGIMSTSSIMSQEASDFGSSYTFEENIHLLRSVMDVSSLADEDCVILEIYLPSERVTMHVSFKPPSTYLYFYPSFINFHLFLRRP